MLNSVGSGNLARNLSYVVVKAIATSASSFMAMIAQNTHLLFSNRQHGGAAGKSESCNYSVLLTSERSCTNSVLLANKFVVL